MSSSYSCTPTARHASANRAIPSQYAGANPTRRRASWEICYSPLSPVSASDYAPLKVPSAECVAYLSPQYISSDSDDDFGDNILDLSTATSANHDDDAADRIDEGLFVDDSQLIFDDNTRKTTLMVRNIARTSTQEDFVEALNSSGFAASYDFAYLPFRALKKRNLGFAFVNFKTHIAAQQFSNQWHRSNTFAQRGKKSRHLTVSIAKVQGKEQNVRLIEQTVGGKENDVDHRPVAFVDDGLREFVINSA
eukprot:GEMP01027553.1.p1 GENE.GEMP01027553.1~~GEMP01027553.1.p1  ORF type:complete len:250 (+),score=69.00 GEMP01027553.1:116-865(+)